ncbi:hypothetical protein GCM10011611_47240 [Aliidongia dinghuensis]|uniref:DUF3501 family protein n=1 Tax=Aliidongia dinghuensis TaxID=1867774 RepID=A0A8J3E5U8_9PROT|nr:DUF3501 family protein [Aliidongia dinghuensis]GGF35461.1 hypothetical protein GCM10011611_47240 [Aliidongia dinghuensis]
MTIQPRRRIERADILDRADYLPIRKEQRARMAALKQNRRVEVGPFATFYFENWDTIRHQILEMLYIENGGETQIADEIEAYGPLVPAGGELVATVMFEIDDPVRRTTQLNRIGGIEHKTFLQAGGEQLRGIPDPDRENTSPEGKASSVQFFHFPLSPAAIDAFRTPGAQILLGFDHPNYGHIALVPEAVRATLAADL